MAILSQNVNVKTIKPCGYHVVIELLEVYGTNEHGDKVTKGGIVLAAETVAKESVSIHIGKVLSIGEYAHKKLECGADGADDWGYKVGDYVCFNAHVGKQVSTDPKDMRRLILDNDVKAKVELED